MVENIFDGHRYNVQMMDIACTQGKQYSSPKMKVRIIQKLGSTWQRRSFIFQVLHRIASYQY